MKMKQYLCFGGGVNSTAAYIEMKNDNIDFEAVYVDHGCDWPETRKYVHDFALKNQLTIIKPDVEGFKNLYNYCWHKKIIPSRIGRWCTDKFKIRAMRKYFDSPCFVNLGIDTDEEHRAKMANHKGMENRFPLLERDMSRQDCVHTILENDFELPMKSGCWFCPFQRKSEWLRLREQKLDLFNESIKLEERCNADRQTRDKKPIHLFCKRPLSNIDNIKPPKNQDTGCVYCEV